MIDDIAVFDFETTGLDPTRDQAIEIAAIRVRGGQVVGSFHTLVRLPEGEELSPKITEITGLTAADLAEGMDEATAFKILLRFLGTGLIVAHNAAFDMGFLHFSLQRLAGRTFKNHFIDTMTIARERTAYPHKLVDMCGKYGIQLDGAHRALNDVYGCWELLKAMHADEPVDRWLNRIGYLKKFGPPNWLPGHAESFGTENRYAG